jgi:Rrf2 family protein
MLLPQTAEYALRATIYIASHAAGRRGATVRVGEIAAALGLPQNYLSKTLHQLARAGVLASTRGPTGGFRLGAPAERITLGRVVEVFAETRPRRCLLGTGPCGQNPACPVHARWKPVATPVTEFFATTTIADLMTDCGHACPAGADLAAGTRGTGGDHFTPPPLTRRHARQESTP